MNAAPLGQLYAASTSSRCCTAARSMLRSAARSVRRLALRTRSAAMSSFLATATATATGTAGGRPWRHEGDDMAAAVAEKEVDAALDDEAAVVVESCGANMLGVTPANTDARSSSSSSSSSTIEAQQVVGAAAGAEGWRGAVVGAGATAAGVEGKAAPRTPRRPL